MKHFFTAVAVLAVVLAAALNLRGAMPPVQDFNEGIYQGWLIGQILGGGDVAFAIKPWPVPNAAAQMLLGLLNLPLGAGQAGIAYLTLYLAGFIWLAAALARRDGRFDPATFLLAVLIGGINSPYWDGYANSQLGTMLYMLHLLRERRLLAANGHGTGRCTGPVWELAVGIAIFCCHAVLLAVFALHLTIRAWQHHLKLRTALVLSAPFALLAWHLLRDDNYGEAIPAFGTSPFAFIAYKA